ncbi:DUF4381 family protein [Luteimonas sp. FCS-9]|uniref:DUF4381 family protein n=1 Tax=Luteimonas sp. FCS-9 TaxID=1547516 RepID=UPI00063EB7A5|nr:DUF4381 family protein [Luteimonas sp. FCS-9]KLI99621.1 membrane protein [Luteimonas sp. FCS-9]
MAMPDLVLRDIHVPDAPGWWPPAPGWWWLAAVVVALGAGLGWLRLRHVRARRRWAELFDAEVEAATDAPARIAAMSALLRRAARRVRPDADRLQGDAWLAFLDAGMDTPAFVDGPGRLLGDGGFRRRVDGADLDALHAVARARFLALMAAGR